MSRYVVVATAMLLLTFEAAEAHYWWPERRSPEECRAAERAMEAAREWLQRRLTEVKGSPRLHAMLAKRLGPLDPAEICAPPPAVEGLAKERRYQRLRLLVQRALAPAPPEPAPVREVLCAGDAVPELAGAVRACMDIIECDDEGVCR